MSDRHGVVIAGAGQAGFQTAASLRAGGFEGPVTLVGDEPSLPYRRPPLSKAYLDHGQHERLLLRKPAFFDTHAIGVESGCTIAAIDRERRMLQLADGRCRGYDHLVLALGARNRRLPTPGTDHENVVALRTLAHAGDIRTRLQQAPRIVVIGGGFIGLEFATAAGKLGGEVTVLEAAPRLMARTVCAPLSDYFLAAHRQAGIDVRVNADVACVSGDEKEHANGVILANGTTIPADLVLLATGVVANTEIASAAGLETDNGIVVDERLLTRDPAISAIGDCAAFVHRACGECLRLESVQNAIDQAKCVAARLLGEARPYDTVAWFWSDQYGGKLQIAGLTGGRG